MQNITHYISIIFVAKPIKRKTMKKHLLFA